MSILELSKCPIVRYPCYTNERQAWRQFPSFDFHPFPLSLLSTLQIRSLPNLAHDVSCTHKPIFSLTFDIQLQPSSLKKKNNKKHQHTLVARMMRKYRDFDCEL